MRCHFPRGPPPARVVHAHAGRRRTPCAARRSRASARAATRARPPRRPAEETESACDLLGSTSLLDEWLRRESTGRRPVRSTAGRLAHVTVAFPDVLEAPLDELLAEARQLRARSLVTYSPKVFIPLTTLCRDVCGYCTFA